MTDQPNREGPASDGKAAAGLPEETPTLISDHPPAALAHELVPGIVIAGRYRIVARLGGGGMGEVYRADDLRLGQPVALKFIRARHRSPERERQFIEELRLGREISHPNVCRLHDIGDFDGSVFISMEYIDGEDLASLLRRIGRLPDDKALALAREMCAGLAAAHDRGIVHRDFKPANVMIDGRGHARITDFGLARFEGTETDDGHVSGTPSYMAPEQFEGAPGSVATDIFALGLTLFELWTGERVFDATSMSGILEQHRAGAEDAIRRARDLDPAIAALIERCVARDPAQRPPSARGVLATLPGRDALGAAISAGETPSPGLVAAAPERGGLSRRAAWLALLLTLVPLAIVAALSSRTTLPGVARLPMSAGALETRAAQILDNLGWTATELPRADEAAWFEFDGAFTRWQENRRAGEPPVPLSSSLYFVVRQSPEPLIPKRSGRSFRVTSEDPPTDTPGMATVGLSTDGRLRSLAVASPSLAPPTNAETDWTSLLREARIDAASLASAVPERLCPVDNDRKAAWEGQDAETGLPIRVEAASLRGRPVWLEVLGPWDEVSKLPAPTAVTVSDNLNLVFMIAIPIAVLALARRNLRRGQGDRRGATRLALGVLVVMEVAALLRMHHVAVPWAEALMIALTLGTNLLVCTAVWFGYLALEPFARRRWPKTLISWARLLEGRWLDAMVGRDVLAGLAAGALTMMAMHLAQLFSGAGALPLRPSGTSLDGSLTVVFFLVFSLAEAMVRIAALMVLLVILRGFLRNTMAAAVVATVLITAANLDLVAGPLAVRAILILGVAAVGMWLIFRFGLVAACSFSWIVLTLMRVPLTLDTSYWIFPLSAVALAAIAAVAVVSFQRSLDGKALFPGPLFEE